MRSFVGTIAVSRSTTIHMCNAAVRVENSIPCSMFKVPPHTNFIAYCLASRVAFLGHKFVRNTEILQARNIRNDRLRGNTETRAQMEHRGILDSDTLRKYRFGRNPKIRM